MKSSLPAGEIEQSTIIINTPKDEIGQSEEVLLNPFTQLEEKYDTVHQQQVHCGGRLKPRSFPACRQCQSCTWTLACN